MAHDLLFYLNKLQDTLNLERSNYKTYPVKDDPLHNDTILTEDIWEASKVVISDLGRRGVLEIETTTSPVVTGTSTFVLPERLCRLISVEYFDGTYWQGPLEPIGYDEFARLSSPKTNGSPKVYTTRQNDSREVYWTGAASAASGTNAVIPLILTDTTHNFATTISGNQIEHGDIVFNTSTDAQGLVDHLAVREVSDAHLLTLDGNSPLTEDYGDVYFRSQNTQQNETKLLFKDDNNDGKEIINFVGGGTNLSIEVEMDDNECYIIDNRLTTILPGLGANEILIKHIDSSGNEIISGYFDTVGSGISADYTWTNAFAVFAAGNVIYQPKTKRWLIITKAEKVIGTNTATGERYVFEDDDNAGVANEPNIRKLTFDYIHGETPFFDTDLPGSADSSNRNDNYIVVGPSHQVVIQNSNPLKASTSQGMIGGSGLATAAAFAAGDGYQIEAGQSSRDTLSIYPIPDRTDPTGAESLKINYIAFPEEPSKASDIIELSDVFADSIISKALEYAIRRESGRTEPYEQSIRRAINAHRPLPASTLMSHQRRDRVVTFNINDVPTNS